MRRNFSVRFLALTISLLLGFLPVQAAAERPFAYDGSGIATFITDSTGNIIGANVTASGTATYLGLFTVAGTVYFAPAPTPGHLLSSANLAFTAANGDKLQIALNGNLDLASATDMGTIRFVGGTGRFAAAGGSGQFVVEINPVTGAFKTTAVARISF